MFAFFSVFVLISLFSLNAYAGDGDGKKKTWNDEPNPLETGLCKDGNCKCGDDLCPMYAHCLNKHCYCSAQKPTERNRLEYTDEYLKVKGFGEFACGYMINSGTAGGGSPLLYCNRKDGCATKDGLNIPNGGYVFTDFTYRLLEPYGGEAVGYYIIGDPGALSESLSESGDCVYSEKPSKNEPKIKITSCSSYPYSKTGNKEGGDIGDSCDNEAVTVEVIDTKQCKGGKLYCHGQENNPVLIPEKSDGYVCNSLGSDKKTENLAGWICVKEDGCECGGKACAYGRVCMNGVCSDKDKVKKDRAKKASNIQWGAHGLWYKDGSLLDLCGRESAEKIKKDMSKWDEWRKIPDDDDDDDDCKEIDSSSYFQKGCLVEKVLEPDRCQLRKACDTWYIPRDNRSQYVCEFDFGIHPSRYHVDAYYYPKAQGLRCVEKGGCVCKDGKIKEGEYCNVPGNLDDYMYEDDP